LSSSGRALKTLQQSVFNAAMADDLTIMALRRVE